MSRAAAADEANQNNRDNSVRSSLSAAHSSSSSSSRHPQRQRRGRTCTCHHQQDAEAAVNLTASYFSGLAALRGGGGGGVVSSSASPQDADLAAPHKKKDSTNPDGGAATTSRSTTETRINQKERRQLEEQLSRRGWCVVELDVDDDEDGDDGDDGDGDGDDACDNNQIMEDMCTSERNTLVGAAERNKNSKDAAAAAAAECTATTTTTTRIKTVLKQHALWKQWQEEMFRPQSLPSDPKSEASSSSSSSVLTFVQAESGDPTASAMEPKQSWEMQRRHTVLLHKLTDGTTPRNREAVDRMTAWIEILHHAAVTVCRLLEIPDGVLLHGDPGGSLDRLRLFRYDAVVAANAGEPTTAAAAAPAALGSSPHTDWGSWTVVWQQDGGDGAACAEDCLQTYCRSCERWNPVRSSGRGKNKVQMVVHVGDATSLAVKHAVTNTCIALAPPPPPSSTDTNQDDAAASVTRGRDEEVLGSNSDSGSSDRRIIMDQWPSPRHRVVSPTRTKRHSLVYFAYPPPDATLHSVTERLEQWWRQRRQQQQQQPSGALPLGDDGHNKRMVPYADYSLLQNQSANEQQQQQRGAAVWSEEDRCAAIANMPWRQVFQDKWNQVQRTNETSTKLD